MLSRGFLVGEIIDELSVISGQAQVRAKLGLTDLHIFIENFCRDIFSIIFNSKFINANANRCNEPGVDLLCENLGWAVQITTLKTAEKVTKTIEKYDEHFKSKYKRLIVFIFGAKQTSYSLDSNLLAATGFNPSADILDLSSIGHLILDLNIDDLFDLHSLLKKEVMKVKIELEIANRDGEYPTSLFDQVEKPPKPKIGNLKNFAALYEDHTGNELAAEDIEVYRKDIKKLLNRISFLPRVSREFITLLCERRNSGKSDWREGSVTVNINILKRIARGFSVDDEVNILRDLEIISIELPEDHEGQFNSPQIVFNNRGFESDSLWADLCDILAKSKEVSLRTALVNMDFGDL